METVYLFYDGNKTRIPAYGNDRHLHTLFTVTGCGIWDADSREYVFNRKIDAEKLSRLLPDTPVVQVGGSRKETVTVTGFFGRSWAGNPVINEPEYFSKEWQKKLETELHARKYSSSTINSYLYYNKALCQRLKKTPDTVTLEDIKKYLAYREQKDRQSAASLNIALSAFKFFLTMFLKPKGFASKNAPDRTRDYPLFYQKQKLKECFH